MDNTAKKIEALLFVSGEGLSHAQLATRLQISDNAVTTALSILETHLTSEHALRLFFEGDKVSIVTAPEVSREVETYAKEEFSGELTRAGLETLTIICYRGPLRRSEIDYIRGVNSSFMIRGLMMRGLIERARDQQDSRWYRYRITPRFLKHLGLLSLSELPEYGSFAKKLEEFIRSASDGKSDV